MAVNSVSPTTFESGVLIADTSNIQGGARSVIDETITPSTALDVQSTQGAFCPPRMNSMQRLALDPSNGMLVYDTTQEQMYMYVGDAWTAIEAGIDITDATYILQTSDADLPNAQSLGTLTTGLLKNTVTSATGVLSTAVLGTDYGNVIGPNLSVANDIAIFSDTSGKVLADSGVSITAVPPPFGASGPLVTDVQLSGVDILSYNDVGLIYTDGDYVVGFHPNSLVGRPPNTVFGFSNPSSPDANVEITQGALLLSRLTQSEINSLIAVDGMMVYNSDTEQFNFYQDLEWVPLNTEGPNANATFILQTIDDSMPYAQSLGTLSTGILKNTVTGATGVLSTAVAGVDYYAPGFPTYIKDTGASTSSIYIGTNTALSPGSSATNNTFLGDNCCPNISIGNTTTAIGSGVLGNAALPTGVTAIGYNAMASYTNPSTTVAIGANSGNVNGNLSTGNCVLIGNNTDINVSGLTNCVAIGSNARIGVSYAMALGPPAGQGSLKVGIATATPLYSFHLGPGDDSKAYFYIGNSNLSPTTPMNGGLLYVFGGALYYMGSSGSNTKIANA